MSEHQHTLSEQAILGILERKPSTFDELLESCHSLFPHELQTILRKMVANRIIVQTGIMFALDDSVPNRWRQMNTDWQENLDRAYEVLSAIMDRIHLPHVLDYEWWFSHNSREELAYRVLHQNLLPVPETIAFLGSPLFGAFVSLLVPQSHVYILDKSNATLDAIKEPLHTISQNAHLVHYDAEQQLPDRYIGIAQMVFFDPPWYVDYYDLFLRRSVQLTHGHYATIAMVLFPILTRPNSLQERRHALDPAMTNGLSVVNIEVQAAHYLTPHFEQESLSTQGIQAKNWRRGDLVFFVSDGSRLPENVALRVEKFQWVEVIIGKVKIKVRIKDENPNIYITPSIEPIYGDEAILASVSRRDPIRDEVDVWTSTHKGFRATGWKAVWKIFEGIRDEATPDDIVARIRSILSDNTVPDSVYNDIDRLSRGLRQILSL